MRRLEDGVLDVEMLTDLFAAVVDSLDAFNALWPMHVVAAQAYPLPMLGAASNGGRLEVVEQPTIRPQHLDGDDAVAVLRASLKQLHYLPGQHPSTVMRYPGVVLVDRAMSDPIAKINAAKQAFEDAFKAAVIPASRAQVRARLFPGVVMLQAYRHIHYCDQPLTRVAFGWAGATSASVAISRGDARHKLEELLRHCPAGVDSGYWAEQIQRDIDNLGRQVSDRHVLRIRKPVAPHPRVSLFNPALMPATARKGQPLHIYHANLPLFILTDDDHPPPQIDPLGSFVRDPTLRERKRRADAEPQTLISARLNLFAVETKRHRNAPRH